MLAGVAQRLVWPSPEVLGDLCRCAQVRQLPFARLPEGVAKMPKRRLVKRLFVADGTANQGPPDISAGLVCPLDETELEATFAVTHRKQIDTGDRDEPSHQCVDRGRKPHRGQSRIDMSSNIYNEDCKVSDQEQRERPDPDIGRPPSCKPPAQRPNVLDNSSSAVRQCIPSMRRASVCEALRPKGLMQGRPMPHGAELLQPSGEDLFVESVLEQELDGCATHDDPQEAGKSAALP
jgi:hypothetical protein